MKNRFITTFSPVESVVGVLLGGLVVHFMLKAPWLESYLYAVLGMGIFHFFDSLFHLVKRAVQLFQAYRTARNMYAKLTKTMPSVMAVDNIVESEDKEYEV